MHAALEEDLSSVSSTHLTVVCNSASRGWMQQLLDSSDTSAHLQKEDMGSIPSTYMVVQNHS